MARPKGTSPRPKQIPKSNNSYNKNNIHKMQQHSVCYHLPSPDKGWIQKNNLLVETITNSPFGPHMEAPDAPLPPNRTESRSGPIKSNNINKTSNKYKKTINIKKKQILCQVESWFHEMDALQAVYAAKCLACLRRGNTEKWPKGDCTNIYKKDHCSPLGYIWHHPITKPPLHVTHSFDARFNILFIY